MSCIYRIIAVMLLSATTAYGQEPSDLFFRDPIENIEKRVENLLDQLTLEEKVNLCHGKFESGGIPRFGIGPLTALDGPMGVRAISKNIALDPEMTDFSKIKNAKHIPTTSLPCNISLACTWDPEIAYRYGRLIGTEMVALRRHVLFGPGVNLMRSPLGGRNFEYFGEDPYLCGELAKGYIRGVQQMKVAACPKHLLANDMEAQRWFTSSNMDTRTLRELYLVPFEASVDAGAWCFMEGNNLFNGKHMAEAGEILQGLIKNEFESDAVILTDWRSAYTPRAAALAGTDMTLGNCGYVFGEGNLLKEVLEGRVPESVIDKKVRRILRLYIRTGVIDPKMRSEGSLGTDPGHQALAQSFASEGMVLLKNDKNILPLNPNTLGTLLVTGPGSATIVQGKGSSVVQGVSPRTPIDGLKRALKGKTAIIHQPLTKKNLAEILVQAKTADTVLFFATGKVHGESRDLPDLDLPDDQNQAIAALAKTNPKLVVILQTGGPVTLPWIDSVPAVLCSWYAGQATGDAIADVLIGRTSPGGKLCCTFGQNLTDYAPHALGLWPPRLRLKSHPRLAPLNIEKRKSIYAYDADYGEGVFIGYRWFDARQIVPAFPFGYGLTYSTFTIDKTKVTVTNDSIEKPLVTIQARVTNTGKREAPEVLQLYVCDNKSSVARPPQELKAFEKVWLRPRESKVIELTLEARAFSFWASGKNSWVIEPGEFTLLLGTSSRDIHFSKAITLKGGFKVPSVNDGKNEGVPSLIQ